MNLRSKIPMFSTLYITLCYCVSLKFVIILLLYIKIYLDMNLL